MQDENWKRQWELLCHAKDRVPGTSIRETVVSKTEKAKASEAKTGFDCTTEVHESTRQRIESVTKGFMKNTLQGKGTIPYCITILCISLFAVDKEWKKLESVPAWTREKSRARRRS